MTDQVDHIVEQWHAERPDLDVSPMAVIGRLTRASGDVDARLATTFARHGLDFSSFDVLATLLRSGHPHQLAPAELARNAMITTSAVAQRLNKLERRGLIARGANPHDGRGTLVTLTAAGRNLVEVALPDHLLTEHAIVEELSAPEQAQLASLLQRVSEAARRP